MAPLSFFEDDSLREKVLDIFKSIPFDERTFFPQDLRKVKSNLSEPSALRDKAFLVRHFAYQLGEKLEDEMSPQQFRQAYNACAFTLTVKVLDNPFLYDQLEKMMPEIAREAGCNPDFVRLAENYRNKSMEASREAERVTKEYNAR